MKLLDVPECQVNDDNPFENDKFNRKTEIENLTTLLSNSSTPIVLAVSSPWGMGKTTFVNMWKAYLSEKKGVVSFDFNAWETDFAEDPLVAFLGEMKKRVEKELEGIKKGDKSEEVSEDEKIWGKIKESASKILSHSSKKVIPVLVKVASQGVLDLEPYIEKSISGLAENLAKDAIESYAATKNSIDSFKENLTKILSLIADDGKDKKLYIFIDELDRCRPLYAVELLERIKHLLNIEGLVFVLSIDRDQLNYSVQSLYGDKMDSNGYLKRFFDLEYILKVDNMTAYIDHLYEHYKLDALFEERRLEYKERLEYEFDSFRKVFPQLAKSFNLSLRTIAYIFSHIDLVVKLTKEGEYIYPSLLSYLLIVREQQRSIYVNFMNKNIGPDEIIQYLHDNVPGEERVNSKIYPLIEACILNAKKDYLNKTSADILEVHREKSDNKKPDKCPYSTHVLEYFEYPTGAETDHKVEIDLMDIARRIEMLESFSID